MNSIKNFLKCILLAGCICTILAGCNSLPRKVEEYSSDKEQCYLNTEDVTQFNYKENNYTILENIVDNNSIGNWIGYIRQLVAIDESGKILIQENIERATFQTLADLIQKTPSVAYIIPFLNVYANSDDKSCLIVDVNGDYHKAILSDKLTNTDIVFKFNNVTPNTSKDFKINPQNATQILCGSSIYQVTSETVSKNELGNYIDILAENVVFNSDTKIPLSKDELNKIDLIGTEIIERREKWFYIDIYEIESIDTNIAIAVKVNNQYYKAEKQ